MTDTDLLAMFAAHLPNAPAAVAPALLVKLRAAERRLGRAVPAGYAIVMARHYLADVKRSHVVAERAVARAAVAKARRLEAQRRAAVFVEAGDQFERLVGMAFVAQLTTVQQKHLAAVRLCAFDGLPTAEVARRLGVSVANAWQYVCRGRKRLRAVATAMGFTALLEVAVDSQLSPKGGVSGF